VERAVRRLASARVLGRHVGVRVVALADGRVAFRRGTGSVTPASTMKLLTAVAALEALGPAHRFSTTVLAVPGSSRITLTGGGDPLLASRPSSGQDYPARADLDTLAARTATALRAAGRTRVRLGYDASLFRGPAVSPRWEPSYVPDDVVSPITALWVEEGRDRPGATGRSRSPARGAAAVFAAALRRHGVQVRGALRPAAAPSVADGGRSVARIQGAPLSQVVQHVLEVSDNEGAEVLARQVALARGRPASFEGAARAVRGVLGSLGVPLSAADRIYDGSGLSRQDRLRPETLVAVLRVASSGEHPRLRAAVAGLPVAGFTGSLAGRFDTGNAFGPGLVRAKTGTLTGVHGLAGTLTTRDGVVLVFVAVADRVRPVDTLEARARLDELTAALAGCRCAATP
ncbi:MAG: D-alanyl-D-alanine carboxypeptidase/D-alanyl-D-alanine-endopeptidase, partial [Nocardioidaceae bacterium]